MNKISLTETEKVKVQELIRNYPLATVITALNDSVEISHLPIVSELSSNGDIKLRGHLSKRNPQWLHLKNGAKMTIVFQGPNTYVNSSWYIVNDVSTWNYMTVQASGSPILEENYNQLIDILRATNNLTNQLYEDKWDFYIPEDLRTEQNLVAAIGGFSLEPVILAARFKLSQSKSLQDQKRIIKELSYRKDENSKEIAKAMSENIKR